MKKDLWLRKGERIILLGGNPNQMSLIGMFVGCVDIAALFLKLNQNQKTTEKEGKMKNEINRLLGGLLEEGLILGNKKVRKCTPSSGAIYLPKDLIGKEFRVVLVPLAPKIRDYENKIGDLQSDVKVLVRAMEKITGKKFRTILEENKEELQKIREDIKTEKERHEEEEITKKELDSEDTEAGGEDNPTESSPTQSEIIKLDIGLTGKDAQS